MFQDVPSFIFSYQPIIHSSKKNFQQNPFLISPFQNFKSSADTFLFLFYFLIYILGKSIDQKSRSLVFKTFHLNLLHKTYPLFSPRSPFENQRNRYLFSLDFLATFTIRLCSQRGRNELINEYDSQEGDPLRGNKIRGQIVASKTCTKFSRISQSRIGQSGQRCVYITMVNRDELQPRD